MVNGALAQRLAAEAAGLICSARGMQTPWGAESKCCVSAFGLASLLIEAGIDCQMVVWLLPMDGRERYVDHWAVTVEFPFILDPSYAQVMGGGRVCTDARYDYPDHYQGPYLYPAKPLLDAGGLKFIKGNISIDHLLYLACVMAEYDGGAYLSRVEALYGKRAA